MTHDYRGAFKEVVDEYKALRELAPAAMDAFGHLHKVAMLDGALGTKTKEMMAMAIGVAMRCEGCIVSHARAAIKAGATPQEIGEAVGVAVLMGGGPATVYGGKAVEAARQFAETQTG